MHEMTKPLSVFLKNRKKNKFFDSNELTFGFEVHVSRAIGNAAVKETNGFRS